MKPYGKHLHRLDTPWACASPMELELLEMLRYIIQQYEHKNALLARIEERLTQMATKEQLDKLAADVAALIDAGVAEITAAVEAAQRQSPDPAIDALDARVTDATDVMKKASEALKNPGVAPVPTP